MMRLAVTSRPRDCGPSPVDQRSDRNNVAISLVLREITLPLSAILCSPASHSSPSTGHSIYIWVFSLSLSLVAGFTPTREFPWLRYPQDEENQSGSRLLHLSLVSRFSLLRLPRSSLGRSCPWSLCLSLLIPPTLFRPLVRGSAAIMTSRGGEYSCCVKTGCTHGCTLHSSTGLRGDRTLARSFVEGLKTSVWKKKEKHATSPSVWFTHSTFKARPVNSGFIWLL